MPAEPQVLLDVRGLQKSFGGVCATDGVDLQIHRGEVHALIGPNGAGKTTLISQLSGLLESDAGRVLFDGHEIGNLPAHRISLAGLARSFQITSVFADMSLLDNVALAVQAHSGHSFRFWRHAQHDQQLREPATQYLQQVGLEARAQQLASAVSHGERRQLEIAMALATSPKMLLLDEPMAGMGPEESARMIEIMHSLRGEKTLLLVEHDMDAVFSLADRISVLVYGRLIATGTAAQIRANEDVKRAYLGEHG